MNRKETMSRNRECPKCRGQGRDKTGDHLWLMEDGVTWCCDKTEVHPVYYERGEEEVKGYKEGNYSSMINFKDVKEFPILGNKERCISERTHNHFKVRTELSEENREPVAIYYPETSKGKPISYKQRRLPKKFGVIHKGDGANGVPDFFGQVFSPKSGKKILICAGEEDTLAAYEMLYNKYPDWEHAVVGLPRGESDTKTVAENLQFLSGFEEVILAMDNDDAGKKATAKLVPIIGEGCKVLVFSEKDLSDLLVKGKEKSFINSFFTTKEYRPESVVDVMDILEEAITPVQWGLSYPWDRLTELTYGMKEGGEIVGIGAAPGW